MPPCTVKADGTDQKVSGHSYYDTVAAKLVRARTVTTEETSCSMISSASAALRPT